MARQPSKVAASNQITIETIVADLRTLFPKGTINLHVGECSDVAADVAVTVTPLPYQTKRAG
jgi:hypothetical protein